MARFNWCNAVVLAVCVLAVGGVSLRAGETPKRGAPIGRKASDKKARLTPEECERLVAQLVNPDKPPFTGKGVPILPEGVSKSSLYERQKNVGPAYDKLSANIEVALPILAKHVNDERFSYVYMQPSSGVYETQSVGGACSSIIHEHVEAYHQDTSRPRDDEGRSSSLFFIDAGCGGINKWWKTCKHKTLAELQLEGIEWALRQKKPEYFKSERDWARAKKALEKMAKEIRDSRKPIKVNHEFYSELE
ncbi:MAG: hypothetical protein HYS12_18595 [Planctomycetes bacterium]|nr:hypothetical protein [Planctomycetota bacterium]